MMKFYSYLVSIILLFNGVALSAELRLIGELQGTNYGDHLGRSCEGVGDINHDGFTDFLVQVGTPGYLYFYYGGPAPFSNPPALTFTNYTSLYFGPVNVGDVNCDGVNDFIGTFDYSDTLKICFGLDSLDVEDNLIFFSDSTPGQDTWIFTFSGGADNNNDSSNDFWIYKYAGSGSAVDTIYGYSSCNLLDTLPDKYVLRPEFPRLGYQLGRIICNNCDLNGDGIADIVWGEYNGGGGSGTGRICIVWGGTSLSEYPDLMFYAPGMGAIDDKYFGSDLDCMGDVSGDGIDDLWVRQGGRNYVYLGGRPFDTLVDYALDYSYTYNIENIGDINHDGWNDVILIYDDNIYSQIAFLYCGPAMDTVVDVVFRASDFETELSAMGRQGSVISLGCSFSGAGDIDGDGIDDVLVGAYSEDDVYNKGRLFIVAGWQEPVAVDDDHTPNIPDQLDLRQNYPNPFNPSTTIEFSLPRAAYTEVMIVNLLGEEVAKPVAAHLQAGEHRIEWDGRDANGHALPTGVYFYRIESGDYSATKKMVLLK